MLNVVVNISEWGSPFLKKNVHLNQSTTKIFLEDYAIWFPTSYISPLTCNNNIEILKPDCVTF